MYLHNTCTRYIHVVAWRLVRLTWEDVWQLRWALGADDVLHEVADAQHADALVEERTGDRFVRRHLCKHTAPTPRHSRPAVHHTQQLTAISMSKKYCQNNDVIADVQTSVGGLRVCIMTSNTLT